MIATMYLKGVKATQIKIENNLKNHFFPIILWFITKSKKEATEGNIYMGDDGEPPAGARISRGP